MNAFEGIIKSIVNRIRALETIQEGNGFVPYLFPPLYGTNAIVRAGGDGLLVGMPLINVNDVAYINIAMSRKVANLSEAILIYIANASGTWDYTIDCQGGYCGEDKQTHLDSITANGVAFVDD